MLRAFYNNKVAIPTLPPPGSFTGKTVIVTGATGGIGFEAAKHFVNLDASSVIITARTAAKGEVAKAAIESQTDTVGKGIVKVMELDMSTFESTKFFVDKVKKELKSIDVVVLNAGMLSTSHHIGKEGYEQSIEVNTLSTALLGILLLPWMEVAGKSKAHLVFVTSGLHRVFHDLMKEGVKIAPPKWPQTDVLNYFNDPKHWPGDGMYSTNKLLEQYCVNEIAKLAVKPDGTTKVTVTPMCPGMVRSDLAREYKTNALMTVLVEAFMMIMSKTTEAGARSYLLAALESENGKYCTHYQSFADYEKAVQHNVLGPEGQKMQAQVWKEVTAALSAKIPEVKTIVGKIA